MGTSRGLKGYITKGYWWRETPLWEGTMLRAGEWNDETEYQSHTMLGFRCFRRGEISSETATRKWVGLW